MAKCPWSKAHCAASKSMRGEPVAKKPAFSSSSAEASNAMMRKACARTQRSFAAAGIGSSIEWSTGAGGIAARKSGGVRIAGSEFVEASSSGVGEIGLRKAVDVSLEIGACVTGISAALGVAAQPIERVGRVGGSRILAQECGEAIVGVGLTIEIRDPRGAPFAEKRVFAGWKIVDDALIVFDRFVTVELDPIIIPHHHQRFFGPFALRIFPNDGFVGREHVGVFVGRARDLRDDVHAFGIDFGIGDGERRNERRRTFELHARLRSAEQGVLLVGAGWILDACGQLCELSLRVAIFFLVEENLRAAFLQIPAWRGIFSAHRGLHLLETGGRGLAFIGKRILVIKKLVVLCGAAKLSGLFVRLRA